MRNWSLWFHVEGGTREQAEAEFAGGGAGNTGSGGAVEGGGAGVTGPGGIEAPAATGGFGIDTTTSAAGTTAATGGAPSAVGSGAVTGAGVGAVVGGINPRDVPGGSAIASSYQQPGRPLSFVGRILAGPLAPLASVFAALGANALPQGQTASGADIGTSTPGGPIEGSGGAANTAGTQPGSPSGGATLGGGAAYYGSAGGGPGSRNFFGGVVSPYAAQDLSGLPEGGAVAVRTPCKVFGIPCWLLLLAAAAVAGYFIYRYYQKKKKAAAK